MSGDTRESYENEEWYQEGVDDDWYLWIDEGEEDCE